MAKSTRNRPARSKAAQAKPAADKDAADKDDAASKDAAKPEDDSLSSAEMDTEPAAVDTVAADGADSVTPTGSDTVAPVEDEAKPAATGDAKPTAADDKPAATEDKVDKGVSTAKDPVKPVAKKTEEPAKGTAGTQPAKATPSTQPAKGSASTKPTVASASTKPTTATASTKSTATPPPKTVVERKGGFVPMVLGGVVAAALGFGAAQAVDLGGTDDAEPDPFETEVRAALDAQGTQLETLTSVSDETVAALGTIEGSVAAIDLGALQTRLDDGMASLRGEVAAFTDQVGEMDTRLAQIDERLITLEKRPIEESVSPDVIAVYERELEALQQEITDQRVTLEEEKALLRAEIDTQMAAVQAMIDAAQASEDNAAERATLAAARAAVADVLARVQDGRPYADPLAALANTGTEVPAALSGPAEEGVPTQTSLVQDFPEVARNALRVARQNAPEVEEEGRSIGSFLQTQLGARSVVPREGDDPDAVLSRAEASVRAGELEAALAELDALPEPVRPAVADWRARAEERLAALQAASGLVSELNQE